MERRGSLSFSQKLKLVEKSTNIMTDKVKCRFKGSLTFHFFDGEIMNMDDYEAKRLCDVIEKNIKIK